MLQVFDEILWLVGLSLKTQELTAMFLAARLCCSWFMEGDIHTFLDFVTLVATLWVVYMMRFKLKSTYIADLDNMPLYYVVNQTCLLFTISLNIFGFKQHLLFFGNAEIHLLFTISLGFELHLLLFCLTALFRTWRSLQRDKLLPLFKL